MKNTRRTPSPFEGGKPEPPSYKNEGTEVSKDAQAQETKEISKVNPINNTGWIIAKIKGKTASRYDGINGHCMIADDKGRCHDIEADTKQEAEELAKRVVTAINMHDKLVEELRYVLKLSKEGRDLSTTEFAIEKLLKQAEQK